MDTWNSTASGLPVRPWMVSSMRGLILRRSHSVTKGVWRSDGESALAGRDPYGALEVRVEIGACYLKLQLSKSSAPNVSLRCFLPLPPSESRSYSVRAEIRARYVSSRSGVGETQCSGTSLERRDLESICNPYLESDRLDRVRRPGKGSKRVGPPPTEKA